MADRSARRQRGEAIRAICTRPPAAGVADCCNEVLKRLDKLDDIAKMLKDLGDQNADLKQQLDDLKAAQQVLESKVNQPPPPRRPAAYRREVGHEVTKEIDGEEPKFQMLGMNVGMDDTGNTTFTGKGRYFAPSANISPSRPRPNICISRPIGKASSILAWWTASAAFSGRLVRQP